MKFRLRQGEEVDLLSAAELSAQIDRLVKALEAPAKPRWLRVSVSQDTSTAASVGDYFEPIDVLRVPQGQEFRLRRAILARSDDQNQVVASFQVLRDGLVVDCADPGPVDDGYAVLPMRLVNPEGSESRFRNGELVQVQIFGFAGGFSTGPMTVVVEGSLHRGAA